MDLPTELWSEIFAYLLLPDLKCVRLVSRYFSQIATPICFTTIRLDLRYDVDRVIKIASNEVARHVRKLILQTTPLLPEFDDFNEWEQALALPGDPDVNPDDYDSDDDNVLMPHEEWSSLSYDGKKALYDDYRADRRREKDAIRALVSRLCFCKLGCARREQVHPNNEPLEASALEQLDEVIKKFSKLAVFTNEPGFIFACSSRSQWRRLRFNPDVLDYKPLYEDEDAEALQLSVILRALGWAGCKIRSMDIYIDGPAFWGPSRLRYLWQGDGHEHIRMLREVLGSAADAYIDKTEPNNLGDRYRGQWIIMQNALVNISHLTINISEKGGPLAVAGSLFEFLCCCEKLKQACLVFDGVDGPGELFSLLAKQKPWPKLCDLELSVVTDENALLDFLSSLNSTLRRLSLSHVLLLSLGGSWDSAVLRIRSVLRLNSLEIPSFWQQYLDE